MKKWKNNIKAFLGGRLVRFGESVMCIEFFAAILRV